MSPMLLITVQRDNEQENFSNNSESSLSGSNSAESAENCLFVQVMTCVSTTLEQQRQGEFFSGSNSAESAENCLTCLFVQVMTCVSTTLEQQRQGEFNGLLRICFAVSLVLAIVGEVADIKLPVLGSVLGLLLVLSTTLPQQRPNICDDLLSTFFTGSLVLAIVVETAAITFPLPGCLELFGTGCLELFGLLLVPFYLYYLAYWDLLGTERFRRSPTNRQKRRHTRLRKDQVSALADIQANEKASANSPAPVKSSADADGSREKKTIKKRANP
jgi:hypothetical protein